MRRIRENDGQNKEKRMNMSGRKGEEEEEGVEEMDEREGIEM